MTRSPVRSRQVKPKTKSGYEEDFYNEPVSTPDADTVNEDLSLIRTTLRNLLLDVACPAAAKAQAARTLAEMAGLLGKHQDKPDNPDARPLSSLSQAELVAELARLQGLRA